MAQILMVVMGLLLSSMIMLSLINYLPSGLEVQKETEILIERGFETLDLGYDAYKAANSDTPITVNASWSSSLSPSYIFLPAAPINLSWDYASDGGTGRFFCLHGSYTKDQFKGFKRASRMFSPAALFVRNSCSETARSNIADPSTFPASLSINYWVDAP